MRIFTKEVRPLSLNQISQLSGFHKSQLYRYLNTFVELGVLIRNEEIESYPVWSLGPELITLGEAAFDSMDIAKEARPYLIMLRDKLNETVALSIWREEGPFFVRWEKSNKLINISLDTGSYVPLYSATGKVFRAFLPEDKTEVLYQKEIENGKIEPEQFKKDIEEVRSTHFSTTTSSLLQGITALSVPIFSSGKYLAGALSVLGVQGRIDDSLDAVNAQELRETAEKISRQLGYK